MTNSLDFSSSEWLSAFKKASQMVVGFRELRAEIFQQTVKVVQAGGYTVEDVTIHIDKEEVSKQTKFYTAPTALLPGECTEATVFQVLEGDCIEAAIVEKHAGYNVCVLNMASRQNPGGGVYDGAGAQEENLFRRSNLFMSMYQFVGYAPMYGIQPNDSCRYPLDRNTGGVYSGAVTFFRGSEKKGYALLKQPEVLAVVSVPAINRPDLVVQKELKRTQDMSGIDSLVWKDVYYIHDSLVEPTKEKMRTICRIAGAHGHDCLVLSAFGCGAFGNPPNHVARLFQEVFEEAEFKNRFRKVVFAILEDHNSRKIQNPQGNVKPFAEVFGHE